MESGYAKKVLHKRDSFFRQAVLVSTMLHEGVDVLPGMNAGASTSAVPSPMEGSGTAWVLLGAWALSPARPTPIHPRPERRGFSALLVIYRHIILTVPAMFRTTFYQNAAVVLRAFMRCGASAWMTSIASSGARRFGVAPSRCSIPMGVMGSTIPTWDTHLRRDTFIPQWFQGAKAAAASDGHAVHF
jgi:hypothetical protein